MRRNAEAGPVHPFAHIRKYAAELQKALAFSMQIIRIDKVPIKHSLPPDGDSSAKNFNSPLTPSKMII
jgi:hypothetical protein